MATARADDQTLALMREHRNKGKYAAKDGVDDETAKELLATPRAFTSATTGTASSTSGTPLPSTPEPSGTPTSGNNVSNGGGHHKSHGGGHHGGGGGASNTGMHPSIIVKNASMPSSPVHGSSSGTTPTGGAAAAAIASVTLMISKLEEESQQVVTSVGSHVKLARDQMQRSIGQLLEDLLREKFEEVAASRGLTGGAAGGGGGFNASMMSQGSGGGANGSNMMASYRGSAAGSPVVAGSPALSLRPVDRASMLSATSSKMDKGRLSDLIMTDTTRKQMSTDLSIALEHELRKLSTLVSNDVLRVSAQVSALSSRISASEESVLSSKVELGLMEEKNLQLTNQLQQSQAMVSQLRQQLADKEKQSDIIREQLQRRTATIDEMRGRFQREVMRYKARILELEMDLEGWAVTTGAPGSSPNGPPMLNMNALHLSGGAGGGAGAGGAGGATQGPVNPVGQGRQRRYQAIAQAAINGTLPPGGANTLPSIMDFGGGDVDENGVVVPGVPDSVIDAAVRNATSALQEQIRQLKTEHTRELKKVQMDCNAKVAERDFEIIKFRSHASTAATAASLLSPLAAVPTVTLPGGKGEEQPSRSRRGSIRAE